MCSYQGGWNARGEEQEHWTGSGNTPPTSSWRLHHTLSEQSRVNALSVCTLKIVLNWTAPTLLFCERNHVIDDYSPFSCGFIINEEKTLGEMCDIRLSTRAAVQIRVLVGFIRAQLKIGSPPPSISETQRKQKLCHYYILNVCLSLWGGWRNQSEMTSAAYTRLHILRHSKSFKKAFLPIWSCKVVVWLFVNSHN